MSSLMQQRDGRFYDKWEQTSTSERDEFIKSRLEFIVSHAKEKTSFYKNRLNAIDFRSANPLVDVPILESFDLRTGIPPQGNGLVTTDDFNHTVFQSGGTTGIPKTSLFSHQELEGLNICNARGFYACGLNEDDKAANLWAVGGLYMTFVHINRMLQQYGCQNFPFSNHTPSDFIYTVAKSFNINTFTGITSVVLSTLRDLHEIDKDLRVEKIFYGGEHIYPADRLEMKEKLGVEHIFAPGYGTVDSWYLGYQCSECEEGVFHAHDDQVYLEIIDEETSSPCKPGEVGMLYATVFERTVTPIIRYRVGDRAMFLEDPCECGRTTPKFKLLGRGDDTLRIGYDSVDYNAVQNLVLRFPSLSGRVQIEKQRLEGKDQLVIRIETKNPLPSDKTDLAKTVEESLYMDRPSIRGFVKKEQIHPVKVEILEPGTLPVNSRTGKLMRVIDAI